MNKNKIIFIIFFLLLAAPAVSFPFMKGFVDSANYEKRTYAKAPKLKLKKLPRFAKQFERYFNDRLPYKNQLVMLNNVKNDALGAGTTILEYLELSDVIRGKEKWLFYNAFSDQEEPLKDYMCTNLYEEQELAEIAQGYDALQAKLKEEYGIMLLVMYVANKEQVYPEYMPDNIPMGTYSRTDQLVDYLREHTDVPLLYTKEALRREKEYYQVFYKYDTHWNNLGGFVGGQLINEYFHGEYVSLKDLTCTVTRRNESGDLADLLSMRNIYNDDAAWRIEDYKTDTNDRLASQEKNEYRYESDAPDKRSVLVIMDSFGYGLMGIAKDFAKVTFSGNTDAFREYCGELKPDILIVEIAERRKGGQEDWCRGLLRKLEEGND